MVIVLRVLRFQTLLVKWHIVIIANTLVYMGLHAIKYRLDVLDIKITVALARGVAKVQSSRRCVIARLG